MRVLSRCGSLLICEHWQVGNLSGKNEYNKRKSNACETWCAWSAKAGQKRRYWEVLDADARNAKKAVPADV